MKTVIKTLCTAGAKPFLIAASLAALIPQAVKADENLASLQVYLSAPAQQNTFIGDAYTETFDAFTPGSSVSGTYRSTVGTYTFAEPAQARGADEHGGANGSTYLTFGAQSETTQGFTLTLGFAANYFGFWWSAGDGKNGISFYYDDTLLARFSTQDILNLLGDRDTGMVTAVDDRITYESKEYFGNPNLDYQNFGQPYSYVNIFAIGATFNKIVFDNSDTTSTGFETDNHAVTYTTVDPGDEPSLVKVTVIQTPAVPEPSTTALLVGAGIGLVYRVARRRKQA